MHQNRGMDLRKALPILLLAAAGLAAHAAPPHCRHLEGADRSFENAWDLPSGAVTLLREVHRRIAGAAGLGPALYLCNDPAANAAAVEVRGGPHAHIVAVNTGLLRLVAGDEHMLAAVIGHEFAHLTLRHGARKRDAQVAHAQVVARDWAREVMRSGPTRDAAARARMQIAARVRAVDRDAEREADDKGFSLAVRAGFDEGGARRLHERLQTLGAQRAGTYLDTHPGLGERSGYSRRLEMNERFRRDAERHLAAGNTAALGALVQRWILEVPDSGAAAYYGGLYLMMAGKPQALVSEAFEDAVTFFDGEGLSRLSQEDQYEARMAAVALCVSLFREDKRRLALHCVQRLRHEEDVERFRVATGWRDFLIVPGAATHAASTRPLFGAQSREGHLFMTNCPHVARERGMKDVRPWRGLREPRAGDPSAGADTLACDPGTCDCEPLDAPPAAAAPDR